MTTGATMACDCWDKAIKDIVNFCLVLDHSHGEKSAAMSQRSSRPLEKLKRWGAEASCPQPLEWATWKGDSPPQSRLQMTAHVHAKSLQSCPSLCNPMDWGWRGSCPCDSPGKKTGMGYYALLQGIFPTQQSNPGLPNCRPWLMSFFFFN